MVSLIYEHQEYLILNKPAGLLVHAYSVRGGAMTTEVTVADWVREHYPETRSVGDDPDVRPGIVHRLDRETSGILLVARTSAAFSFFKSAFTAREIQKTYLAVVHGVPNDAEGSIDAPIGLRNGTVKRTVHGGRMIKAAKTEYALRGVFEKDSGHFSVLQVQPKTGRTHQIRVHLASIGHPIVGDMLYGTARTKKIDVLFPKRLFLHAFALEFSGPDGKRVRFEAEPDPEFRSVIHNTSLE